MAADESGEQCQLSSEAFHFFKVQCFSCLCFMHYNIMSGNEDRLHALAVPIKTTNHEIVMSPSSKASVRVRS